MNKDKIKEIFPTLEAKINALYDSYKTNKESIPFLGQLKKFFEKELDFYSMIYFIKMEKENENENEIKKIKKIIRDTKNKLEELREEINDIKTEQYNVNKDKDNPKLKEQISSIETSNVLIKEKEKEISKLEKTKEKDDDTVSKVFTLFKHILENNEDLQFTPDIKRYKYEYKQFEILFTIFLNNFTNYMEKQLETEEFIKTYELLKKLINKSITNKTFTVSILLINIPESLNLDYVINELINTAKKFELDIQAILDYYRQNFFEKQEINNKSLIQHLKKIKENYLDDETITTIDKIIYKLQQNDNSPTYDKQDMMHSNETYEREMQELSDLINLYKKMIKKELNDVELTELLNKIKKFFAKHIAIYEILYYKEINIFVLFWYLLNKIDFSQFDFEFTFNSSQEYFTDKFNKFILDFISFMNDKITTGNMTIEQLNITTIKLKQFIEELIKKGKLLGNISNYITIDVGGNGGSINKSHLVYKRKDGRQVKKKIYMINGKPKVRDGKKDNKIIYIAISTYKKKYP